MLHLFIRRWSTWLVPVALTLSACGDKPQTAIQPSEEMQQFLGSLNGTAERVNMNLKRWSTTQAVLNHEIRLRPLAQPLLQKQTIGTKGECYQFEALAVDIHRAYTVCWRNKKIVSVKFEGMRT